MVCAQSDSGRVIRPRHNSNSNRVVKMKLSTRKPASTANLGDGETEKRWVNSRCSEPDDATVPAQARLMKIQRQTRVCFQSSNSNNQDQDQMKRKIDVGNTTGIVRTYP